MVPTTLLTPLAWRLWLSLPGPSRAILPQHSERAYGRLRYRGRKAEANLIRASLRSLILGACTDTSPIPVSPSLWESSIANHMSVTCFALVVGEPS